MAFCLSTTSIEEVHPQQQRCWPKGLCSSAPSGVRTAVLTANVQWIAEPANATSTALTRDAVLIRSLAPAALASSPSRLQTRYVTIPYNCASYSSRSYPPSLLRASLATRRHSPFPLCPMPSSIITSKLTTPPNLTDTRHIPLMRLHLPPPPPAPQMPTRSSPLNDATAPSPRTSPSTKPRSPGTSPRSTASPAVPSVAASTSLASHTSCLRY